MSYTLRMLARVDLGNRLFRHDCQIAINTARANFTGWADRLIAGAMLFVALAAVRSWSGDQPWKIAAWAAFGICVGAGFGAGRLLAARIAFHSFDGLLAADAVQPSLCRRYMAASHGIGITTLTAITLIARPSLLIISTPAYMTGVFMAGVTGHLAMQRMAARPAVGRTLRRLLHHPGAGVVAAMILLLSLLPAHALGTTGQLAVAGIEAVLFAVALTIVERDIVRFKAISGHSPGRIVVSYSYGLLSFAGITVPVCWCAMGPVPASIILVASAAMLLLLAMRVFAYCVHSKRFADFLVSVFAGLLALVGFWMIVLLPFVAVAVLWQLQRRAAAKTWLLA
jgi:hypothetical protein